MGTCREKCSENMWLNFIRRKNVLNCFYRAATEAINVIVLLIFFLFYCSICETCEFSMKITNSSWILNRVLQMRSVIKKILSTSAFKNHMWHKLKKSFQLLNSTNEWKEFNTVIAWNFEHFAFSSFASVLAISASINQHKRKNNAFAEKLKRKFFYFMQFQVWCTGKWRWCSYIAIPTFTIPSINTHRFCTMESGKIAQSPYWNWNVELLVLHHPSCNYANNLNFWILPFTDCGLATNSNATTWGWGTEPSTNQVSIWILKHSQYFQFQNAQQQAKYLNYSFSWMTECFHRIRPSVSWTQSNTHLLTIQQQVMQWFVWTMIMLCWNRK